MSELDKDSLEYGEGVTAMISTSISDGEYETAFEVLSLRSLTLLRDEGDDHTTIDALIYIGRVCEKSGIPTNKSTQTLLASIVNQYRDDN